jgi:hypothetical protein
MRTSGIIIGQRGRGSAWKLAVAGAVLVLGWKLGFMALTYVSGGRQALQLSGVLEFKQDLWLNRSNTSLVFCQDTAEGVGIYFCKVAEGKSQLLGEQKEKGRRGRRFTMLGWSPDESLFACAVPDDERDGELILFFNGQTGAMESQLDVDIGLTQFAWLANDAFAYATATSVRIVAREAAQTWVHRRYIPNVATNLRDFVAVSANTVAWQDNNSVFLLDLTTSKARKIWEATTNQLVQLTYVRGADEFLLNCRDATGQQLLRLRPGDGRVSCLGLINTQGDYVRNAYWNGQGSSYVFLTNTAAGSALCIKTPERAAPIIVPWQGGANRPKLSGRQVFFHGFQDGDIPGIWSYDLQSERFKCVFSSNNSLKKGLIRSSMTGVLTNRLGEQRTYHVTEPANAATGKKYPVLLAQELNIWFAPFHIASREGFIVAVVDRPYSHTWDGDMQHTWAEDVAKLYEVIARHPHADTNRIYLYGCSRDTAGLSQLMAEQPALAKGLIFFSPTALPNPGVLSDKSILIVTGQTAGDKDRLAAFQDRAAQSGNAVSLLLQADSAHMPASGYTERRRALQFYRFITAHN